MRYSIFKAPLLSFYSKDFYNATAREGKGFGWLYLFVVVLVSSILGSASACWHFNMLVDSPAVDEIVKQLPDMSIKGGRLSINKASPYKMPFRNAISKEEKLIVFDTSANAKPSEEASLVLGSEGVLIEGQEGALPWSMITMGNDFELPAAKFKDFWKSLSLWFFIACVALTPLAWLGHVLLSLLYGAAGLFMDGHKLGYKTAIRMASTAMTPSIVITTLFYVLYCKPELWEVITIPISLGYLFFAYNSVKES